MMAKLIQQKAICSWRLQKQVMRYGELKNSITHITDKVLTTQLRQLEEDGFILRQVYAVVPPKVEYSLTARGRRSIKIVETIRLYGLDLMREMQVNKHKRSKTVSTKKKKPKD
jgi:DNA-binding HxlR family transcriptional regulator